MKKLAEGATGLAILAVFALAWFPGGTIWMGSLCGQFRLDWLDWVLSVVIPGYGFVKGLSCL